MRPPVVFESHGLAAVSAATLPDLLTGAVPGSSRKQRRLEKRDAGVWRTADGYVAITRGLADDLERKFGARNPGSLAVVPDGVRLSAQRDFDWPAQPTHPVVGYVGHLYPWKGPHLLLQALSGLENVRAIIVGGHPAERDLQRLHQQAHTLGLTARVTFTGYVDRGRIPDLLAAMDVLVLPHTSTPISERYASPLKLFEYMAAGRPIVASDLASIREVLTDEAAVLVAPGDPATLAAGIRRTLDDWDAAGRRARRAYELVSDYTWDRRAERLDLLLEHVVSGAHIG
jgi:glycosyltransferase involved in cell wall biosynthesis